MDKDIMTHAIYQAAAYGRAVHALDPTAEAARLAWYYLIGYLGLGDDPRADAEQQRDEEESAAPGPAC